ncbi:unnamed protein product [Penicillium salamii]|nr:unnamed protein product [Penicillium salamii]
MDICKEQPQIEEWHLIGLLSSFPDISQDNERCHVLPACKTLSVPNFKSAQSRNRLSDLNDQVLQCPHSSFPLKQGNVFDIEDIGTPHGAGIRCFRHGWKFDLFTGKGDSGPHKLNLWDIELRDSEASAGADKEVWVRRPPQAPN